MKGLHLAHLNIRSLWNKIDVFRQTIKDSGLDFISLSESWLNSSIDDNLLSIQGYTCFRLKRTWTENNITKKGGGLCCYVSENICVSRTEFINHNISSRDIEVYWLSLVIPNSKNVIIGNIYRPPQRNVKNSVIL